MQLQEGSGSASEEKQTGTKTSDKIIRVATSLTLEPPQNHPVF